MSQEIRCPSCGGSQFEVVSPGRLRCTSETITSAVPPGQGGNLSSAPIPIYGRCGTVYTLQEVERAAARAAQRRAERQRRDGFEARRTAEKEELQVRKAAALAKLAALGNPGLVERSVPGRHHLSLSRKLLGKVGEVLPVEVEPAWPVGTYTWQHPAAHGEVREESLETGITPTGRIVPMKHGTKGDSDVEILYSRWSLPSHAPFESDPPLSAIVAALELCLPSPD